MMLANFPTSTGIVIGFEETEVQVPENITDGVKLLCLEVLNGTLMRRTVVSVSYQDGSAISEYTIDKILYTSSHWLMGLSKIYILNFYRWRGL